MKIDERIYMLECLIKCMKCEVSGKYCDNNCKYQYEAGNMGDIIDNFEQICVILRKSN